jgi:hypothetical protein
VTATINGVMCNRLDLTIPHYGIPWGQAELAEGASAPAVGARVELVAAGVTFSCTITDSGERGGVYAVELVGGAGGWATPAPPLGHRNDAGVQLSTLAAGLAEAVGETVILDAGIDRAVGALVARGGGPGGPSAGSALSQFCALPEGSARVRWYVDPAGITRLGARLPLGPVDATEVDAGERREWVAYAEEDASGLLPGATIDGRQIAELRIEVTPTSVREVATLVDTGPAGPHTIGARMLAWLLDVVRPLVLWRGVYTYRVTGGSATRINAVPVSSRIAPAFEGLRFWPGAAGHKVTPKTGAKCLVAFADGNPNAPVIVGWMPLDADKGKPERADYDGGTVVLAQGTKPVGRGGAVISIAQASPGVVAITLLDPDGNTNIWTLAGTALTVTSPFPNSPTFYIDEGRADVLV